MARKPTAKPKPEAPVFGELAASGPGLDLSAFIGEIKRPSDELLASLGGDLTHYERLLRDDQVYSTFQQRRRAVTSREWEVVPGGDAPADKAAAEFLGEQLRAARWDRATDKMAHGIFYGYAVAEMLWGRDGSRITIDGIKVRKAKRFRWDAENKLRLLRPSQPKGEIMPERKFWTFSAGADNDDDPYGRGLGYYLYWPVFLKRNGAQFWALALEKYGGPTALGKYPPGTADAEIKKLLETLHAMRTDSAVVIPDGMAAELLQSVKQSGGDFAVFLAYWDKAITKVILSQTMTTEDGSSQSQAQIHMEVRDDVVKGDADLVCESFNGGPAVWLTEWNFPGAVPPKVWRIIEEPEDLKATAERDKMVYDMGFEPSEDYVREKYGDGWSRKAPATIPDPTAAFAEPGAPGSRSGAGSQDTADELTDQADAAAAPAMDKLIGQIRELIFGEEADLQGVADRLVELYPKMDAAGLAEAMRQALTLADLRGRAEIIDG